VLLIDGLVAEVRVDALLVGGAAEVRLLRLLTSHVALCCVVNGLLSLPVLLALVDSMWSLAPVSTVEVRVGGDLVAMPRRAVVGFELSLLGFVSLPWRFVSLDLVGRLVVNRLVKRYSTESMKGSMLLLFVVDRSELCR
jgi:hypothetical protein